MDKVERELLKYLDKETGMVKRQDYNLLVKNMYEQNAKRVQAESKSEAWKSQLNRFQATVKN